MIRKLNHLFYVYNHTGVKRLSHGFANRKDAVKRLGQIEFFKHQK